MPAIASGAVEPSAQELGRQVDLALVEHGQGFVDQVHVAPPGPSQGIDVAVRRQPQMVRLALLDQLVHGRSHLTVGECSTTG